MNSNEFDDYIKNVLNQIVFVFEHKNIKRELMSHLADLKDEYAEQGLESSELTRRVIEDMGDPVVIGKELNQIHHPIIGWLWWISRLFVVVTLVYSIFFVGSKFMTHQLSKRFVSDQDFDINQFMSGLGDSEGIAQFNQDLALTIKLNDGELLIDRLIQTQDGTIILLYQEIHAFDLFHLNERIFDLHQYGQLHIDDEVFNAKSDGLLTYEHWHVLIYENVPLEFTQVELKYKQVSETFEKALR